LYDYNNTFLCVWVSWIKSATCFRGLGRHVYMYFAPFWKLSCSVGRSLPRRVFIFVTGR
jgi:hypothetical protein